MGVALSTCALPGGVAPARLGPSEIEMGLGIHGEPGAAVSSTSEGSRFSPLLVPSLESFLSRSVCHVKVAEITAVDDIVEKLTARRGILRSPHHCSQVEPCALHWPPPLPPPSPAICTKDCACGYAGSHRRWVSRSVNRWRCSSTIWAAQQVRTATGWTLASVCRMTGPFTDRRTIRI